MYENNNQGEHDLTASRVAELKIAGWAVPLDTEAVEDGARNIRLNADKAALAVNAAAAAAEAKTTAALGEVSRRVGTVETTANTAKSGVEQLRGSIATHETRIGATERANQELNGRVQALENTPAAPAPSPAPVSSSGLSGPGRPDVSSTLSRELASAVTAAPVGSVFTSTDGAGTGAWAWLKTPTGWQVTYGDTGWRNVSPGIAYAVHLRRIGGTVHLRYKVNQNSVAMTPISLPGGFSTPAGLDLQRAMYRGGTTMVSGYFRLSGNALIYNGGLNTINATAYEVWGTSNAWPSELPGVQV